MPSAIGKHNTFPRSLLDYMFKFKYNTNDEDNNDTIHDFDQTFNYDEDDPYIHMWPYTLDMRVYTKGIGGLPIRVHLDHDKRTYKIVENDVVVIEEKTPHALQRKLYDAGYVTYNTNSWSSLWVTHFDNMHRYMRGFAESYHYVLAKDLNHKYAQRHGFKLTEKIRKDIPNYY